MHGLLTRKAPEGTPPLPSGIIAEVRTVQGRRVTPRVEIASINPILILRNDGEAALRTAPGVLNKTQLREAAKSHQLVLSGHARSKTAVKAVIIEAGQFRLSERAA